MQNSKIILYGSDSCHKTRHYQKYLEEKNLSYTFHNVILNREKANELRSLYKSGKLNFPSLLVAGKKLRNPPDLVLENWLRKKGFINKKSGFKIGEVVFTCGIDASRHDCGDAIEY